MLLLLKKNTVVICTSQLIILSPFIVSTVDSCNPKAHPFFFMIMLLPLRNLKPLFKFLKINIFLSPPTNTIFSISPLSHLATLRKSHHAFVSINLMPERIRAFVHGHTFLHSWSGPMTLVVGLLHGAAFLSDLPLVLFVSFIGP